MITVGSLSHLQQLEVTGRVDDIPQLRVLPLGQVVLLLSHHLLLLPNRFRSAHEFTHRD